MRGIVLAALVACTPLQRTEALATSSTLALAADWMQTRDITSACQEQNPILGECGQRAPVDFYFPVTIVLNLAFAAALPASWRDMWLGAVTGAEAATVWSNYED